MINNQKHTIQLTSSIYVIGKVNELPTPTATTHKLCTYNVSYLEILPHLVLNVEILIITCERACR